MATSRKYDAVAFDLLTEPGLPARAGDNADHLERSLHRLPEVVSALK